MNELPQMLMTLFTPAGHKAADITPEDLKAMSPEQLAALTTAVMNSLHPVNLPNLSTAADVKPAIKKNTGDQSYPILSEAIEQYFEHKKDLKNTFKPNAKQTTIFRRLIEILGDIKINEVGPHQANTVLRTVRELPGSKAAMYRNKTVTELMTMGPFEQKFTEKNINDYMYDYRAFFNEMNRLYQVPNSFNGLIVKETDKKPKKRLSFDRNDLKLLFSQPLFQSGEYQKQYQFWTPLIALFSGARRVEIAQLRTYDIDKEGDIWYFDFNEEIQNWDDGDKKIKNTSSFRKTPVHPFLIELGLLNLALYDF
jgi:integrase